MGNHIPCWLCVNLVPSRDPWPGCCLHVLPLQEEDILPRHPVYPFISGRRMAPHSKWNLKEAPTPQSISSTGPTFKLPFWLIGPDYIWPSLPAWDLLEEIKACGWKGLVGSNEIILPKSPLLREAKSEGSPIWQISLVNLPFGKKKKAPRLIFLFNKCILILCICKSGIWIGPCKRSTLCDGEGMTFWREYWTPGVAEFPSGEVFETGWSPMSPQSRIIPIWKWRKAIG